MSEKKLRTQPIKGLIIFLIIDITISMIALGYFIYDVSNLFISILVYIFGGMFFIIGVVVLLDQLFHYVEVKNDSLVNHILWKKYVLPFEKIKRVILVDEMYHVYSKKKRFCVMPSHVRGSNEIIIYLERQGISLSPAEEER
ncbi:MAG: hypothetical protein WC201_02975 [Bacilli bacterium]